MNCANHPDVAVVAYCQSCGKPLCAACMRSVGGVVYCEPCLQARVAPPPGTQAFPGGPGYHAHPLLAGLLGFIPGVGAMYNGQFVKALAHVVIFAVFVSLADHSGVFGLMVAAWVFYQVFDAAQTARARRDGLPLPNPFGLNDLGPRLGITNAPAAAPYGAGYQPPPAAGSWSSAPSGSPSGAPPADPGVPNTGEASGWNPVTPPPGYASSQTQPPSAPGMPVDPGMPLPQRSNHPVGAIILIAIGVVLLMQTLGVFDTEWIGRTWPILLIGIGGWLLYRRARDPRNNGDGTGGRRGGF
jgi:LiaI-LiaF-like transmembrane region/B-box zinc finger